MQRPQEAEEGQTKPRRHVHFRPRPHLLPGCTTILWSVLVWCSLVGEGRCEVLNRDHRPLRTPARGSGELSSS